MRLCDRSEIVARREARKLSKWQRRPVVRGRAKPGWLCHEQSGSGVPPLRLGTPVARASRPWTFIRWSQSPSAGPLDRSERIGLFPAFPVVAAAKSAETLPSSCIAGGQAGGAMTSLRAQFTRELLRRPKRHVPLARLRRGRRDQAPDPAGRDLRTPVLPASAAALVHEDPPLRLPRQSRAPARAPQGPGGHRPRPL